MVQKATNEQLSLAYAETNSVWRVAERFGMCGQSVHERLQKLGIVKPMNVFTDEERARLRREYHAFADAGKLQVLADSMGRTKPFICRQAREIGLTDQKRPSRWMSVWKYISDEAAEVIWEDFKKSSLGLGKYCQKKGYDDLGFSRTMQARFPDEYEHVIELKAPKQTRYRYGRAFEYRCRDLLKKLGYFALRSPASRSPIDVLAVKHGTVLMVQAKRGGVLPPREWNPLFELAQSVGAIPLLATEASGNRGVKFLRLLALKSGRNGDRQPMEPFEP